MRQLVGPGHWVVAIATLNLAALGAPAKAEEPFRFEGTTCAPAAYLHCPDSECSSAMVINQGNVVEMKTRRTYFLDYPCDLKPGEKVTFILSLHGGGSYGNWQRHYFPLLDYKDEYRLVIATPNSPTRAWSEADDEYLQNIVDFVTAQLGAGEHQGVLAGRSLAGRHDLEPADSHRLLQEARGRLAEPVGRSPGRQSRPRRDLRADSSSGRRNDAVRRARRRAWLDRPRRRVVRRRDGRAARAAGRRHLLHLHHRRA